MVDAGSTNRLAFSLLCLCAVGCSDKLIGINPSIEVAPDNLAFGQGAVGASQQIRVSVSNTGSAPLVVSDIRVSSDPSNELSVEDLLTNDCDEHGRSGGRKLAPGECARFTVTWSPGDAHDATGAIEVTSNDPQSPVVTLPVSGRAVSPALQVCVLDADGTLDPAHCSDLGANPPLIPTVDFGTGLPQVPATRKVRLTNQGGALLTFLPTPQLSASVGAPSVFSLAGQIAGAQLAPGASADLLVTATPTTNGTMVGEINIASNDSRAPQVAVPLQIFVAGWQLCIDPASGLDFGTVTIGQSQTLGLTFTNCGSSDFTIDQFSFLAHAPTTSQFTITSGALPAGQTTFPTGARIQLGVTYTPTAAQSDSASVDYQLAVGGSSVQGSVPIVGQGLVGACGSASKPNPVPSVAASFSTSQNGAFTPFNPSVAPSPVIPLDWVKLNASASTVAGTSPTYTWQLVSQPTGSTTALLGAGVQVSMQTLVSGAYVVSLTIKDGADCAATSSLTINVVPVGDIHVELTWPESCGDVDLHFVAPGDAFCGTNDVSYFNKNPDWGCRTAGCGQEQQPGGAYPDGTTLDDASLDRDDLWGNGPENVTQKAPFDSPANLPYQVWVYYYSSTPDGGGGSGTCGAVHPRIDIYVQGVLRSTFTLSGGMTNHQTWHTADITIANQASSATVTPRDGAAGSVHGC